MVNPGKEENIADYHAIVIGSGAGGLSAALSLTRNGFSVLLLEAMPSFGGYLNPFRKKQYTFYTGLRYLGQLGKGEAFWSLLDTLGLADTLDFIELDPDGGHAPRNRHTVEILTFVDYHVFEKWSDSPSLKRGDEYRALKERIGEGSCEGCGTIYPQPVQTSRFR